MAEMGVKVHIIEGITVSTTFDTETLRSALNYKAQPDDVFLCVYPKSGTTWLQVVLYGLTHDGEAFDNNMSEYFACTPTFEQVDEKGMNIMHRPYVLKTHLPLNRIPYNEKANRQPDQASFDAFFEAFISGNVPFGDYFEHLKAIWQYKDKVNVFLTSYEEMKHDFRAVIRRLAQFMNIELNDNLLERIVTHSSFGYMKEHFGKAYMAQARIVLADKLCTIPRPISKSYLENFDKFEQVRQGTVGGWSSTMSAEQAQRLDKIFAEKTKDMPGLDKFFLPQQN